MFQLRKENIAVDRKRKKEKLQEERENPQAREERLKKVMLYVVPEILQRNLNKTRKRHREKETQRQRDRERERLYKSVIVTFS